MTDYQLALDWLEKLASEQKFFRNKDQPSLETTQQLLSALSRPDEGPEYRVVIGGTAGKGTTARYVEQTCLEQGKTTALISSPHLQVINERIRINGQLISSVVFAEGVLHIKEIAEIHGLAPTYYEAIVVAGIYIAAQFNVEILICEVGLGGEFDAVNAVQGPRVAAVTFIGDDHLEMFDNNMKNLAVAKAGIFTEDSVLNLTYEQKYSSIFNKIGSHEILYLKGIKTKMNKKIARNVCEKILNNSDFTMQSPVLPARWEKVREGLILDGAHSAPRFEYILPKIKKLKRPRVGFFGMKENHDPKNFEIILPEFDEVYWVSFPGSIPAKDLQVLHKTGHAIVMDPDTCYTKDKQGLVTGSLHLCGEAREDFYPSDKILEQQTEWPKT